jgi:NAD(P)-dependent dehydrogenase (short-subunit alcohol dehydrogenase family)
MTARLRDPERESPLAPPALDSPEVSSPAATPEELRRCVEILESFVEDRARLSVVPEEVRLALIRAAGRVSRPMRFEQVRAAKAFRRIERKEQREADRETRAATEIRTARRAAVFTAPPRLVGAPVEDETAGSPAEARELTKARNCYVCKVEFRRVHFFYDSMCDECATLNYEKRFQTAPLHGKVALITGARLKIGYQSSLMMLRAGARVIVTTRFPNDAAARYAREEDYEAWHARLQIHGLDLRHSPSVEIFARYILSTERRLDILINNAAQTVRRPPRFYAHLIEQEALAARDLSERAQPLLRGYETCKRALALGERDGSDMLARASGGIEANLGLQAWPASTPGIGILAPAALSQIPCAFDEALDAGGVFPAGALDADLQQVDLRAANSWRMTLAEVPTPELLEVQLVNAIAPFILCSKLKPLMMRDRTDEKHVVNVSAMEGKFSRHTKTDKHPHTNMAKASLNMMTLTSAPDYAKSGIFMNAVDTGWVTDEDAAPLAARKQDEHDFQPPLDIVDGAARVCDPFFSGILTGNHVWGKFLKDYKSTTW